MYRLSKLFTRQVTVSVTLLLSSTVSAGSPAVLPTGIDWLDWATEQVAFTLQEAAPAETVVMEADTVGSADPLAATHSIETIEIHRLQQEIFQLRQLIEQEFIGRMIALETEIRDLKYAMQAQQVAGTAPGPVVPRPDGLRTRPAESPDSEAEDLMAIAEAMASQLPPPEEFDFIVVDEWGRSPEVVADLGGDATTLIGLAGLVPPRSSADDVKALVRELRATYNAYDNINIEIFDTETAAQAYAERQIADPAHHVASISRHKASGRDVLLYLGGAQPEEISISAE